MRPKPTSVTVTPDEALRSRVEAWLRVQRLEFHGTTMLFVDDMSEDQADALRGEFGSQVTVTRGDEPRMRPFSN